MRTRTLLVPTAVAVAAALSACAGDRAVVPAAPPNQPALVEIEAGAPGVTEDVVAAAGTFLSSLSAEQRDRAVHDADDPALRDWIYFPTSGDRNGVPLGDLTDPQRAAALGVAEAVLSDSGYAQLQGVIAAEDALGVRNGDPAVSSDRYFVAFFGEPSATQRFAVQINGHHLAVNTTFEADRVSPTPAFTGVDPVDFELDGRRVRPMQPEADAVAGLLGSLDEGALAAARIGPIDDVRVGTGDSDRYPDPEGVLVSDLTPEQRENVTAAVRAWVGDTDERVAASLVERYRAGYDRTRIAWSGSTDPNTPGAYLRIDGPRLWIEFSNVGRFGNGDDHYHSVFRDEQSDYLADGDDAPQ